MISAMFKEDLPVNDFSNERLSYMSSIQAQGKLRDSASEVLYGLETNLISLDSILLAAPHGPTKMGPGCTVPHDDHVLDKHGCMHLLNGGSLASVPESAHGNGSTYHVFE